METENKEPLKKESSMQFETNQVPDKLFGGIPSGDDTTLGEIDDDGLEDNEEEKKKEEDEIEKPSSDGLDDEEEKKEEKPTKKENEETDEENKDSEDVISDFKETFGEAEGIFEDTTEGLKDYFSKVLEREKEEAKKTGAVEYLEAKPELKALDAHLAAGFGVDSFLAQKQFYDYSKIELKADDEKSLELAEQLYRTALKARGNDEEEIDGLVTNQKDAGKLLEAGNKAKTILNTLQQKEIDAIKEQEKVAIDKAKKEEEATLSEINSIIKKGEILGLKLPEVEAKRLQTFVNDDKARNDKYANLTMEQNLIIDLLVLNDFKTLGAKPPVAKAKKLSDLKAKTAKVATPDLNKTSTSDFRAGGTGLKEMLGQKIE